MISFLFEIWSDIESIQIERKYFFFIEFMSHCHSSDEIGGLLDIDELNVVD